jgi:hypothetical protein
MYFWFRGWKISRFFRSVWLQLRRSGTRDSISKYIEYEAESVYAYGLPTASVSFWGPATPKKSGEACGVGNTLQSLDEREYAGIYTSGQVNRIYTCMSVYESVGFGTNEGVFVFFENLVGFLFDHALCIKDKE